MDNINRNKAKQEYLKNIQNVNKTLSGKLPSVLRTLEREMSIYAQHEDFESATRRRNQLNQLLSIARTDNTEVYINNPNFIEDVRTQEIDDLTDLLCPHLKFTNLLRIECFDVAHLAGTFPTASMVTFVNGEPDKRFYRHFKVSSGQQKSDFESIRSVISRRAKHFIDWGTPDLIIVDGGKSQVTAAYKSLGDRIPIVGAAKRRETLVIPTSDGFFEIKLNDGPALHLISRLRDEAHRFARRYHHKLVARALRASSVGR